MNLVNEIVAQERLENTRDGGYRIERRFLLTDVGGSSPLRLYQASVSAGVPQIGEPHPALPDLPCSEIRVETLSADQFSVTAIYEAPSSLEGVTGGWTIEWASGTGEEEKFFDIFGDAMTYPVSLGVTGFASPEVQVPRLAVRARRSDGVVTARTAFGYLARVNSVVWNSFAVRTWLCTNMTHSAGTLTMEFSYAEDTWDFQTPGIFNVSTQILTLGPKYQVYPSVDFTPLGVIF